MRRASERVAADLPSAPQVCPVCGDTLHVTRLACPDCATEVAGYFRPGRFARLSLADEAMLTTFLVSRGNMRDLASVLGVSYPTARSRFADLLERLGLQQNSEPDQRGTDPEQVLRRLAAGEIGLDEAAGHLSIPTEPDGSDDPDASDTDPTAPGR